MGRPARGIALEARKVQLPKELWDALDRLHHDPVRNKPKYGANTRLFERLVRQHLKAHGQILDLVEDTDASSSQD